MKKVYVPCKGPHDYSPAEEFGEVIFLLEGTINRYNVSSIVRTFTEGTEDASSDDYILISGLPLFNAILCGVLGRKFGSLNILH